MIPLIRIALRNVLRNRRRSLITLSAIFLALTVMVGMRGFLNGIQAMLRESIIYGQTGAVQVHKKGFLGKVQGSPLDLDMPVDDAFLAKIRAVPHVTAVAARIPFGGMVNQNDSTVFAVFQGLDPVNEVKVCPRRYERIDGGVALHGGAPEAGDATGTLLKRLGAKIGDKVALLTNDHDGVMNAADLQVVGTFPAAGFIQMDKNVVLVPLGLTQELLRMPGRATEIAVGVDDLKNVDAVVAAAQKALGGEYEVNSWHDVASYIDEIVATQNSVMGFVTNIFLFMALLGIANTMLMSVRERTREIGTMMAVGVRRRQILGLFLLEAAILGFAGGLFGAAAGLGLVHYLGATGITLRPPGSDLRTKVYPFIQSIFIVRVLLYATIGAALASLYPARRASSVRPVEALSGAA